MHLPTTLQHIIHIKEKLYFITYKKAKAIPLHAMKALVGRVGISLILYLSTTLG
jgi:hypothetical protein